MTLLAHLVAASQRVAAASARLVKVRELAAYLKELPAADIEPAVHYLSGDIRQGRLGVAYGTIRQALEPAPAGGAQLSIAAVDRTFELLGGIKGAGASRRRLELLRGLFSQATAAEREFLCRLLIGELRQGALGGVMLDAIAAAAELPGRTLRRAAMYARSLGTLAGVALARGAAGLEDLQLELFVPVLPMLAQTAADVGAALLELGGEAAFEWKMDGARIQVHKAGDEVRIYSRGLNPVAAAVPEIVAAMRALAVHSVVLDGEAIVFDPSGRPQPFQVTMRRFGRRLDVEALRAELPIRAYFFDCLRIDDRSLADQPARERVSALARAVPPDMQMPRLVTSSEPAASAFYDAALAAGHEGLMAKSLEAPYEAGNRGASWLKIKRAHTLDLVVLAAEWGHGRRTGTLSNLHLGALDPRSGGYVMLGKTFKGLTDTMLDWQTRELLSREVRRDASTVYVRPELVVEIAFSDLQASPRYPGGLALRLARVKRYREDKGPHQADTLDSVRRIHAAQTGTPAAQRATPAAQGGEPS
ncbi:MAG TPA: ATP-dependent DNA ligase [Steroidobacteraceae bacterium]|nr:ATP-dependent DNA ligase [Steroidobacteraceae bacterium]